VLYRVTTTDGEWSGNRQPGEAADAGRIKTIEEPIITAMILTPVRARRRHPAALSGQARRPEDARVSRVGPRADYLRAAVQRSRPRFLRQAEDDVRGYASLDYHVTGYWPSPLVKLDILVNGDPVDALSIIVHRDMAYDAAGAGVEDARADSRQMFEVAIQAAIGGRIVARESVKALRKNVLAKCYGGDISRKRKLLEKQKEGKKRMKRVGASRSRRKRFWRAEDGHRQRDDHPSKKSTVREYFESIVIAVILALFVRPSSSRRSRFPPARWRQPADRRPSAGEQVRAGARPKRPVERRCCGRGHSSRRRAGFKYPVQPDRDFIKRVIGLPGETLEVKRKKVYINGKPSTSRMCTTSTHRRRPSEFRKSRPATSANATAGCGPARSVLHHGRQPR
jgi:signal peptidase I